MVTFENVCRVHTKRQVIIKINKFNMFITAAWVLFLIKLRWPKSKSIYDKVGMFLSSLRVSSVEADHLPIAGRLQFFVKNWQVVTNDPWVLSAISGYHIPFTVMPHQDFLSSLKVSVEDELLIDKELGEQIQNSAIHLVSEHDYNTGFCQQPVCDPQKGRRTKTSLIQPPPVKSIYKIPFGEHFKMEGIHMLRDRLKPNDFMAKIDLKDAFNGSNLERPSKVPQVSMEEHSVGVRIPPIWNSNCPQGLYKDSKTGDRNSSNH